MMAFLFKGRKNKFRHFGKNMYVAGSHTGHPHFEPMVIAFVGILRTEKKTALTGLTRGLFKLNCE